jgi:branched-chain amino acid transport system substrate-binding protein
MNRKGFRVLTVLMLIVLVAVSCAPATPAPAAKKALPKTIVVGCLEPLTGKNAVFGVETKYGMELAIKHINDGGGIKSMGGIKLELVSEDAGDTADTAKLGAESIISKNHPVAILGAYISRITTAVSEVTDREKVILVADALVDSLTTMGRRYLFRPAPKAGAHGKSNVDFLLDYAKKNNFPMQKVAILNEDSSFGHSVGLGAIAEAQAKGLTVVYQKEYSSDITDVSAMINDINNAKPDAVLQAPYFTDAVLFAKTFQEVGARPKYIAGMGGSGYADPSSVKTMGDLAQGYSNSYSYNPAKNTAQNKKFVEEFKALRGYNPSEAAGMNYYGMMVLYEALEKSGQIHADDPLNPDNLRDAFMQLDLTSGPAVDTFTSNHIKFDANGDNIYAAAVVMQNQNGVPRTVWPLDQTEADAIIPRKDATY